MGCYKVFACAREQWVAALAIVALVASATPVYGGVAKTRPASSSEPSLFTTSGFLLPNQSSISSELSQEPILRSSPKASVNLLAVDPIPYGDAGLLQTPRDQSIGLAGIQGGENWLSAWEDAAGISTSDSRQAAPVSVAAAGNSAQSPSGNSAIPLPSGAWSGLSVLIALTALALLRRARRLLV